MSATVSPRAAVLNRAGTEAARPPKGPVLSRAQFRQLAEFRYHLRRFLHFSQDAAERCGLRPQQYQLLLALRGMPAETDPTIANVAAKLMLKHNSAVELVDRAIDLGFVRRTSDPTDHRRILLRITPEGDRLLRSLAEYHMKELEEAGPGLIRALRRIASAKPPSAEEEAATASAAKQRNER